MTPPGRPVVADVIAALMAAEGPDRELDAQVGIASGHFIRVGLPQAPGVPHFKIVAPGYQWPFGLGARWTWNEAGSCGHSMAPYTALLDAALTLLPADTVLWSVSRPGPQARSYAEVMLQEGPGYRGEGATAAIAVCVAALTAISGGEG